MGLLGELEQSRKYAVYFIEEEKLLAEGKAEGVQEGIEIGEEKGEKKKAVEMAKRMRKDNKTTEEIQKYTQLSIEEIRKL